MPDARWKICSWETPDEEFPFSVMASNRGGTNGEHTLVLFAAGWNALNAPSHDEGSKEPPLALPRSRLKAMAFYPFTLPLTTGPGAIAVTVALGTTLPYTASNLGGTILAILATVLVIWICFRYSDRVSRSVGAAGADALARIFAFILICLGVSIFWQGFSELWLQLGQQ